MLKGLDIVVMAQPPAAAAGNAVLAQALRGLWERLTKRCNDS